MSGLFKCMGAVITCSKPFQGAEVLDSASNLFRVSLWKLFTVWSLKDDAEAALSIDIVGLISESTGSFHHFREDGLRG